MARRAMSIFLALILAAFLGAGWYFYKRGFNREWRQFVAGEFQKRGVEISMRQLAMVPFRGIVARDLKVYEGPERKRVLAAVDEVVLVVDYAQLAQRQPFLQALDLRRARLYFADDRKGKKGGRWQGVQVAELSGRLLLTPQKLVLSSLEAEIQGVTVVASGRLLHPQALKLEASSDGGGTFAQRLQTVLEKLRALSWEKVGPRLEIRFSGDLEKMDEIEADLRLTAGGFRYSGLHFNGIRAGIVLRDGTVSIEELEVQDGQGRLEGSGRWELREGEGDFRLRSSLDLLAISRVFPLEQALSREMDVHGRARLELDAVWAKPLGTTGGGLRLLGRLETDRISAGSVRFEGVQGDFSYDRGSWSVRGLTIAHRSGVVKAEAMRTPDRFRMRLSSRIRPEVFAPLVRGELSRVLGDLEFQDVPHLELEADGADPENARVTGRLECGRGSYRKVGLLGLKTPFRYEAGLIGIGPFQIRRTEGEGSGEVEVDLKGERVVLKGIKTRLKPVDVLDWINPVIARSAEPYLFVRQAPNVLLNGVVDLRAGGPETRLWLDVDAAEGMDYVFLNRKLSSPKVTGKLFFTSRDLKITGLDAVLFGGHVVGDATVSLLLKQPGHRAKIQFAKVDFSSLTKLYFGYEDSKGLMDGLYEFTGAGSEGRTMKGEGWIRISEGNVFAIPFLGPFSSILNGIVPGMGMDVARWGEAGFQVDQGVIRTENLKVVGNGFSMFGKGKLFFLDDAMDFSMRVNAQGIPGVLLFPVSKLFEYVADEKLSKPKWRPRAVPRFGGGREKAVGAGG